MICRKQGRRCAQTAEETKHLILATAGEMFCNLGYEKVSLRNISEAAGVSHSLIRHHFGSKEQIWYTVSDTLNAYMENYIQALIDGFSEDKPANVVLYSFSMKLLAHMLHNPQPMQFIGDAIRQEGEFFDYFLGSHGKFENITQKLIDAHNEENPDYVVDLWELKWQLICSAHGAVSLKPLLDIVWKDKEANGESALLRHWQLYENKISRDLNISPADFLKPKSLDELILPIACDFSNVDSCKNTVGKFA